MAKYATRQRKALIKFFTNNLHKQFTAAEIFNQLKDEDISLSAIYRNLLDMEDEGIISKFLSKDKKDTYYQFFDEEECRGIIHLVCLRCKETYHMDKNISNEVIQSIKNNNAFTVSLHAATLYGTCNYCNN